jgi:pimeloyl-ACP methyl ester carboxylesterase
MEPDMSNEAGFEVQSVDGTPIAVWVDGNGPPLVLVHGALSDHTTFARLIAELRNRMTTFTMDRRGRAASGDGTGEYYIEREFEDVAAVADAVAMRTGQRVALWGHSYGADCAMGGAGLTKNVDHVVLYEPGFATEYPSDAIGGIERAIAAGDREAAILALLYGIVGATEEEVEFMRSSPLWSTRLANVATMPRELRGEGNWVYRPGQFDRVTAPTLLLSGSESPPIQQEASRLALAALPNARITLLGGHGHIAHQTDPAMIASVIWNFASS